MRSGAQRKIEASREFFEEHARGGDGTGFGLLLAAQQRRNVVFHRGEATRLQKQNLSAAVGNGPQAVDDLRGVRARAFEQSLRDERSPAASGAHDVDRASAALENFHGGDADFGIVMIGEGVVKERDLLRG